MNFQLTESAGLKAAVITHSGIYIPKRVVFGLCGAPNFFAAQIGKILKGLENVKHFQDDIIIATEGDERAHLEAVKQVLVRLNQFGLKINIKG